MLDIHWRPIQGAWPGRLTAAHARKRSPFTRPGSGYARQEVAFSDTLELLERELRFLTARRVVFQVALAEADFRIDGTPRANARAEHPGVIVAFESKYGPLQYATDLYTSWQANVRAVALSLEALRKVDRYGVTKRGEQYTGWSALPPGTAVATPHMTADEAARVLRDLAAKGGAGVLYGPDDIIGNPDARKEMWRYAVKLAHPDRGGDPAEWARLDQAIQVLGRVE